MAKSMRGGSEMLIPQLMFKDTLKAMAFYKKALGARKKMVMMWPDGKRVMHAQMTVGDAMIMMGDEVAGQTWKSAESGGGSPVSFYLYVKNADATFKKAVAAGASVKMPVADMFWGDRTGMVLDPFGYSWMIATHKKNLTPAQMKAAGKLAMAKMGK